MAGTVYPRFPAAEFDAYTSSSTRINSSILTIDFWHFSLRLGDREVKDDIVGHGDVVQTAVSS